MCDYPGLTANIAGESYDLNSDEIRLIDYDLDIAAISRLSQRYPDQLGDTDLGYRMAPRYSDFAWALNGASLSDYWEIRARFLGIFVPRVDDPIQFVFNFGDFRRALDVVLDGEFLFRDRVESVERVSGVLKSSDPRLYDPDIVTVIFDLEGSSGDSSGWPIPWPIPWPIGTSTLSLIKTITYAGGSRLAAPEYPVIRVKGPITDPVIENLTTDEKIDLSANGGIVLADSSEWVDIDLSNFPRRDSKTIRDQDGESVDQYLSTDSDLSTFHLAPAGELLFDGSYCTGNNLIEVSGDDVDSETQVLFNYHDRYYAI